jgi:hypothetical protein
LLKRIARDKSLEWVSSKKLDQVILSGPHRRWIEEILDPNGRHPRTDT